jgi:hypothetical protein
MALIALHDKNAVTARSWPVVDSGLSRCGIAMGDLGIRCRRGTPESKTAPEGPFASIRW